MCLPHRLHFTGNPTAAERCQPRIAWVENAQEERRASELAAVGTWGSPGGQRNPGGCLDRQCLFEAKKGVHNPGIEVCAGPIA